MAWIPAQEVGGNNNQRSDELRIRASNLELGGLTGLQPMADKLAPSFGEVWRTTQPSGKINLLALDIPLQATEKTRFGPTGAIWRGSSGSCCREPSTFRQPERQRGKRRTARAYDPAKMPYETVFRAPLEIARRCDSKLGEQQGLYAGWPRYRRAGDRRSRARRLPLSAASRR